MDYEQMKNTVETVQNGKMVIKNFWHSYVKDTNKKIMIIQKKKKKTLGPPLLLNVENEA